MFKFFITTTFMLSTLLAIGQYSVRGVVTDADSGEPLPNASVRLSPEVATVTNESGQYYFGNVKEGSYEVVASFIGYASDTKQVSVNSNLTIDFALSTSAILTDAVVVSATRATDKTPTTFTNIDKKEIQQQNFGQDVPFLLNWTPSVVTTSDAGAGIGYTGIRIRGSDPTRINVTINGIPYNDAESLGTFWVNISDIAASSENIQIQRGVGTSTNGGGAFGATINLQTNQRNDTPYADIINSYGSFNSRRHSLSFGSGRLNNNWYVEGRVSKIKSDGFIDRAFSDLSSYYFSAGYYSDNTIVKAITFGGKERTYQAWYGVPESRLNNDVEAMQITAMNEGWNEAQTQNLLNSNSRTFNPYTYPNQVDDYQQDHFQLHFSQKLFSAFTWNTALHYTPGKGFYEEYRIGADFSDYGLAPVTIGDSVIESTDFVRRRWLDNDFYGMTWSLNYERPLFNAIWGGGWNRYDGDHFGEIIWAQVSPVQTEYRYYFNRSDKRDFNSFLKANYQISESINGFLDLQYRRVTYEASGLENEQFPIDVNAEFNFFNPKAGLTFNLASDQQLYASYAIAHREPVRNDFIDAPGEQPTPERLGNLEVGLRTTSDRHLLHANYYYMKYNNQLVLTGEVNDVGAYVRTNAGESYRMGVELEGMYKISRQLQWSGNLTLSRNKIEEYKEVLEDYGDNFDDFQIVTNTYKNTDISFSPNLIIGSQLGYSPAEGLTLLLMTKYVDTQYLDNTMNENRMIDAYVVNDVRISYEWKPRFVKSIMFSGLINNVLDESYESNGYTWGYLAGAATYRENYYYPQAGRNYMAMISIRL